MKLWLHFVSQIVKTQK